MGLKESGEGERETQFSSHILVFLKKKIVITEVLTSKIFKMQKELS